MQRRRGIEQADIDKLSSHRKLQPALQLVLQPQARDQRGGGGWGADLPSEIGQSDRIHLQCANHSGSFANWRGFSEKQAPAFEEILKE